MSSSLRGKVAIVTGGANGIGLAIARELATRGAAVRIFDLECEAPAAVAASITAEARAEGHVVDVTEAASIEEAFRKAGSPDIVCANAGTAVYKGLSETSRAEWERVLAVNLTGLFDTLRIAAGLMKPRRRGSIVLTASTNSYDGEPNLIAYNATKAGVLGILHTAANELGPYQIRVNAVCPGLIRTRLTQESFKNGELLKDYFRDIPLGRGGEPEEVAKCAAFLASDDASYVTGAALLVDGGQMASKFGTWNERDALFVEDHWELKS
jgi:meso-butanediol dehydrogenase / (S,S)-butanediol dehydrogenase / diacetyl reductase